MPSIAQQLGHLFLDAVPTVVLFVLLHYFLKAVLYRPLQRVLGQRADRIEGKLTRARETAAAAEQKLAAYEAAVREQRARNYQHLDARRQQALRDGQAVLAEARQRSAKSMIEARQQLAAESAAARAQLQSAGESLAGQILDHVLGGLAAAGASKAVAEPGAGA